MGAIWPSPSSIFDGIAFFGGRSERGSGISDYRSTSRTTFETFLDAAHVAEPIECAGDWLWQLMWRQTKRIRKRERRAA
jgi:hypothetical protein